MTTANSSTSSASLSMALTRVSQLGWLLLGWSIGTGSSQGGICRSNHRPRRYDNHCPQPYFGRFDTEKEDTEVNRQLKVAGETLGIKLLDHIIFNNKVYYSFLEHNELYLNLAPNRPLPCER